MKEQLLSLKDKAGIVSMEYGVEAYCPAKHEKRRWFLHAAEEKYTICSL